MRSSRIEWIVGRRGLSWPTNSDRLAQCTLALFVFAVAAGATTLDWWVASSLEKVRPMDTPPSPPVHRADVYAARNEFEPFQIVLRARGSAVSNVNLESSDLRSRSGDVIGKANITIYAEQFINVRRPSLASGDAGEWPDALVPQVDRYAHEKRNAFPLSLSPARDQAVWIEIFVPETAAPGEYFGTVQAMREKEVQFKVPVHLTVWKFTLPSTASLKSSYGFNGTTALKLHYGRYTSDDDLYELTRLYAMAALLH